jgi:hypothetical protein
MKIFYVNDQKQKKKIRDCYLQEFSTLQEEREGSDYLKCYESCKPKCIRDFIDTQNSVANFPNLNKIEQIQVNLWCSFWPSKI